MNIIMTLEDLETINQNIFVVKDIIQTNEAHLTRLRSFKENHPKKQKVITMLKKQNQVAKGLLQNYWSLVEDVKHNSYLAFLER